MKNKTIITLLSTILLSCTAQGPVPFKIGKDACDHCKMTVMSKKNGMEFISDKGKIFKFDDISCGVNYLKANKPTGKWYVADFQNGNLVEAEKAFYLKSDKLRTPMNSSIIAFATKEFAEKNKKKSGGEILTWPAVQDLY